MRTYFRSTINRADYISHNNSLLRLFLAKYIEFYLRKIMAAILSLLRTFVTSRFARWLFDSSRTAVSRETRRGGRRIAFEFPPRSSRGLYFPEAGFVRELLLSRVLVVIRGMSEMCDQIHCVISTLAIRSTDSIGHSSFACIIDVHNNRQVRAHSYSAINCANHISHDDSLLRSFLRSAENILNFTSP